MFCGHTDGQDEGWPWSNAQVPWSPLCDMTMNDHNLTMIHETVNIGQIIVNNYHGQWLGSVCCRTRSTMMVEHKKQQHRGQHESRVRNIAMNSNFGIYCACRTHRECMLMTRNNSNWIYTDHKHKSISMYKL